MTYSNLSMAMGRANYSTYCVVETILKQCLDDSQEDM